MDATKSVTPETTQIKTPEVTQTKTPEATQTKTPEATQIKTPEATQIKTPETFKITGNWDAQSKLLKERFSQLTDADLKFETGKENDLLTRVQAKLNKKREEVISIIDKSLTTEKA